MMKKTKILITDDEPHIVNIVKLALDSEKFDVTGSYSARETLRMVEDTQYDLLIIDIMMPGVNGYELCQALRERPETKNTPILILSAKEQMNDKLHAIDVGADEYIVKPFDPQQLEQRITLMLGSRVDSDDEKDVDIKHFQTIFDNQREQKQKELTEQIRELKTKLECLESDLEMWSHRMILSKDNP